MKEQFVKITNLQSIYCGETLRVNKFYENGKGVSVFDPESTNRSTMAFWTNEYELVEPPDAIQEQK